MLQLPNVKYATALHKNAEGVRHFAVYVWRAAEQDYALLLQHAAPKAVALDCLAYAGLGYVALAYNHTEHVEEARDGSPIYELAPDQTVRTVQYFGELRLRAIYLRISSQELTLLRRWCDQDTDTTALSLLQVDGQHVSTCRCDTMQQCTTPGTLRH